MNPEILQAKVLSQVIDQIYKSSNSLSRIAGEENDTESSASSSGFSYYPLTPLITPVQKVSNHYRDWFEEELDGVELWNIACTETSFEHLIHHRELPTKLTWEQSTGAEEKRAVIISFLRLWADKLEEITEKEVIK